jgi:hypothetical protein
MEDTKLGAMENKDDAAEVARQGFKALMAGNPGRPGTCDHHRNGRPGISLGGFDAVAGSATCVVASRSLGLQ